MGCLPLVVTLLLVWNGNAFLLSKSARNRNGALFMSEPVRLNKVLKQTHSRREADALIRDGRVTVNDALPHSAGMRVDLDVDVVKLDGQIIHNMDDKNEYIKYWKPRGVLCTTDLRWEDNIVSRLQRDGFCTDRRVYPVGRLDRDTSGLILLTSDGRLPNRVLGSQCKQPKTYLVRSRYAVSAHDVDVLRRGISITTQSVRDGKRGAPRTATTLPCDVTTTHQSPNVLSMTIVEGRNRQIKRMLGALGHRVTQLHRTNFMGITLDTLRGPGDWQRLSQEEMKLVQRAIES